MTSTPPHIVYVLLEVKDKRQHLFHREMFLVHYVSRFDGIPMKDSVDNFSSLTESGKGGKVARLTCHYLDYAISFDFSLEQEMAFHMVNSHQPMGTPVPVGDHPCQKDIYY